ncbi:MAG: hypothetical protein IJ870_05050 [Alphaproteobacteria bacterium]|nr:hypothetical protein [Alphaproteobacteria bacterium]
MAKLKKITSEKFQSGGANQLLKHRFSYSPHKMRLFRKLLSQGAYVSDVLIKHRNHLGHDVIVT